MLSQRSQYHIGLGKLDLTNVIGVSKTITLMILHSNCSSKVGFNLRYQSISSDADGSLKPIM